MSVSEPKRVTEDFDFSYEDVAIAHFISVSKKNLKWNMLLQEAVQKEASAMGNNIWNYILRDEQLRAYFENLLSTPESHRFWLLPSTMPSAAGWEAIGYTRPDQYSYPYYAEKLHYVSPSAPARSQSLPGIFSKPALIACLLMSQQAHSFGQSYLSEIEKLNYSSLIYNSEFTEADWATLYVDDKSEAKPADKAELETIFRGLAENWQNATQSFSLNMRRYAHPTYHAMMAALGKEKVADVVPLILRELHERPDIWFEALKVLTNSDPAKHCKTFDEAVSAWTEWAKKENYI